MWPAYIWTLFQALIYKPTVTESTRQARNKSVQISRNNVLSSMISGPIKMAKDKSRRTRQGSTRPTVWRPKEHGSKGI